eukprot:TRINITY_DN6816_c0_g1_i1.p2 TRINITY_DN6816_c0_g1~~TRINITY_DN6816_c0_g1_i1.p2  ORF type:complete len:515 (+),score=190.37 TRINITY_DN6816_c0_g1_i1:56-1600(+)
MSGFATQKGTSKAGISHDKEAGKRRDVAVSLRQKKKEEMLEKRRKDAQDVVGGADAPGMEQYEVQKLPKLAEDLHSGTPSEQLNATLCIRKMLSAEHNPPIDNVINADCVPKLVEFLRKDDHTNLQFEASWALTNIASGTSEHTLVVIHSGAVPEFIRLLNSPSEDVREQSIWALGNVAGDSAKCRDLVLNHEILPALLKIIHSNPKITTLRNATWCLSNLFRGKPIPDFDRISPALPTLAQLVYHADDEVVADACWAVSYASDGPNERIDAVLELGLVPRLAALLGMPQYTILCPALRTIGNIVTGSDTQTQKMIDAGILPSLCSLMNHQKRNVKKECCWAVSNITAGTKQQIQAVIDAGLMPLVVQALQGAEFEVKKEAMWAISNLTNGGTEEQIYHVVQAGCLPPMVEFLSITDARLLTVVLEGIDNILASGETIVKTHGGTNEYKNILRDCGGIDAIENLQAFHNQDVYTKAVAIIESYFEFEEGDAPAADQTQFTFDGQQAQQQGAFNF